MYDIIPIPSRSIFLEKYIILYIFHSIIYTEKERTCGSGKKYKECCGK